MVPRGEQNCACDEGAADPHRDSGRLDVGEAQGEKGPHDAPAIHRKKRQTVKHAHEEIVGEHEAEPAAEIMTEIEKLAEERAEAEVDVAKEEKGGEQAGEGKIDGGTGEGDEEFAARFLRHRGELGDPSNREKENALGGNSVAAGGEGVSQFVRYDAAETSRDDGEAPRDPAQATDLKSHCPRIDEKEEKSEMEFHLDSKEPTERKRPTGKHRLR